MAVKNSYLSFMSLFFFSSTVCARILNYEQDQSLLHRRSVDIYHPRFGIYGGSITRIQKHPYLVGILFSGIYFCAGTIISEKWVTTIAGCVAGLEPNDLTIVAGSNDGVKGDYYDVKNVIVHPNYGMTLLDYEFACVEVRSEFKWSKKIRKIKLPNSPLQEDNLLKVAGWGLKETALEEKDYSKTELKQGTLIWTKKDYCAKTFSSVGLKWTERMSCVLNKNKTTLCLNDWGTGLIMNGTLYGMFAAVYPKQACSDQAGPILLADVINQVNWILTVSRISS